LDKDRTNILLDRDVMISLKNTARLEGKSVTSIVREAITEYLSKRLGKHEFGIIGIGESNVKNLSAGRKYNPKDFKKG